MSISFIKLDVNILNDSKIKIVRKLPEGQSLFVLWVGMLCLAMKSSRPGVLEISDGLAYNPELLAGELDLEINTVRLGLEWFEKLKMIETLDNGEIFLPNFSRHQNLEKIEKKRIQDRERKRRERAKLKSLAPPEESSDCPDGVTEESEESHADVTAESDSCHADVTAESDDCHAGVTELSDGCHAHVTRDSCVTPVGLTRESENVTQQTKTKTKTKTIDKELNYIPATPAEDCGETNPEPEKIIHEEQAEPKPQNKADPEIKEFCLNFLTAVQKRHGASAPKKPNLEKWQAEVEKLICLDGFTLKQIKCAVRWAMTDSLWSPNILSLGELRRKKAGSDLTKFQKLFANYTQATSAKGRTPPRTDNRTNLQNLCGRVLEKYANQTGGVGYET